MSGIKALEKLREWSRRYDNRWLQPDGTVLEVMGDPGVRMGENYGDYIRSMLDAVESEVSERYMELPVDSDGMPIRVGDTLECHANGYDGVFDAFAVGDGCVIGNHPECELFNNPFKGIHVARYCHHVSPDSIGRVALDMRDSISEHVGLLPDEVLAFVERLERLERAE